MTVNIGPDEQAASEEADRFLNLYYGMNIWGDRWGPYGPAKSDCRANARVRAAGVQTMIVRFASFDQGGQMQRFLDEVGSEFS